MNGGRNRKPVSPIYTVAALWLLWSLIVPLITLLDYIPLIVVAAILYKKMSKKSAEKQNTQNTQQAKKSEPYVITKEKETAQQVQSVKKEETSTGNEQVDKLIKERNIAISEMRRLNANIEDEKISAQIDDLEYTTSKIFDHVIAHPDKVNQISKFLNYYLPTTMKLLNTYDRMGSQGVTGENITGTMKKVENTMDMVVEAFHKQLDTLFAGEALDVSADIQVMENLMKTEGLTGDGNKINLTLSE